MKVEADKFIDDCTTHEKKESIQIVAKIDDEDRQFLKSMINQKGKSKSKTKKYKKDSTILTHSVSANSLYLHKKSKSKSKNKKSEMDNLQSIRLNLKFQEQPKKVLKPKVKVNP